MASNRKLKILARKQARRDADLAERMATFRIGDASHDCPYCSGTGEAPNSDERTACGFCAT